MKTLKKSTGTTNLPEGIYPIRGIMGVCFLLVKDGEAVIIDTGLAGEHWIIRHLFKKLGLMPSDLRAILLTHGHLDHTGNLFRIKEWSGAPIYAFTNEHEHINGEHAYSGISQVCGWMEAVGRFCLHYRPSQVDRELHDKEFLPFWDGLEVLHLPGHTQGHCGFYSRKHDLLFSGDLFASYWFDTHFPPPILNSQPERIPSSVERVHKLNPKFMLPCHYDLPDPKRHRERFDRLTQR